MVNLEELKELEELEKELKELEEPDTLGEEDAEEGNEIFSIPVDSLSGETYELTLSMEEPEEEDEEELELTAEFFGELAEAQELGFIKKIFRKIKRGFKKLWRKKWVRAALIAGAVVGAGALYKFSPAFKAFVKKAVFKTKQKWWGFKNWLRAKKWRVKRWWYRRRWLARVRKLRKRHPRSWWRRLQKARRLALAYKAKARARRYLRLFRKTRKPFYLRLYRRWLRAYRRLIRPRHRPVRPAVIRPAVRTFVRPQTSLIRLQTPRIRTPVIRRPRTGTVTPYLREKIRLRTPQIRTNVPKLRIQTQKQQLNNVLAPLFIVGGALTLMRLMRG